MADMLDVINAIFDDSGDEEDFEGFDEEAVEEAARRLLNLQDDYDEENEDEPAAVWRSDEGVVRQMPDLPEFLENGCIKVAVPEDQAPVSYFNLFFTDDIIGGIVTDTNRFAEGSIAHGELLPHSRAHSWRPVSADELRLFSALFSPWDWQKNLTCSRTGPLRK